MQILDYDEDTHHLRVSVAGRVRVHGGVPAWLVDRLRTEEDPIRFYRERIADAENGRPYPLIADGATADDP